MFEFFPFFFLLSCRHDNQVKHIKVLFYQGKFGLVDKDSCDFQTLPDLVKYYTVNSLSVVFNGLHSTLKIPLRWKPQNGEPYSQRMLICPSLKDFIGHSRLKANYFRLQ